MMPLFDHIFGSRNPSREVTVARRRLRIESLESKLNLSADWLLGMGGLGEDVPRAGVETDSNDNVYIAGDFFDSIQVDPANSPAGLLTSNGSSDVFVAKYDSSGEFVWARSFGGSGNDYGWGLAVDDSDNVILTGNFQNTVGFGTDTLISVGDYDGFVAKLDNSGAFQWVRQMAGDGFDRVFNLDVDQQGSIYIGTQSFSSDVTFDGLPTLAGDGGAKHAQLAKIDAGGTFQWARSFRNGDVVNHLVPVVDDRAAAPEDWSVTAVGEFSGQLTVGAVDLVSQGDKDGFLVQVDAETGEQTLAVTSFGGPNLDRAVSLDMDASGKFYVAGYFAEETDFDLSLTHPDGSDVWQSKGPSDPYLLRLNHDLSYDAVTSFGGDGFEALWPNALTVSETGEAFLSGHFEAAMQFDDYALVSSGEDDGFVVAFDNDLRVRWADRFGGAGDTGSGLLGPQGWNGVRQSSRGDAVKGLALDNDGNLYVAGIFKQSADFSTGDRLSSNGDADVVLAKLDLSQPRISGNLFADVNANGLRDERLGEGILEDDGWRVELVDAFGIVVDSKSPLGNSGNYSFGAIDPGTYTVRQVLPTGWTETTPGNGYNLTVSAGDDPVRIDFGNTIATQSTTYQSSEVNKRIRNNRTFSSRLTVPDELSIFDIDVQLNITHTYDADLDVFLVAPDGTEIELVTGVGGSGDNFNGTILDDDADVDVTAGQAPFTGRYRPEGNLATLAGKDAQGVWTLRIADTKSRDQGRLNGWSLTIFGATATTPNPTPPSIDTLTASPDPVVQGAGLTLTTDGVTDDSEVVKVEFFHDLDDNGILDRAVDSLFGEDVDGSDGWSATAAAAFPIGTETFLAIATDDTGVNSNVVVATAEVVEDDPGGIVTEMYISLDTPLNIPDQSSVSSTINVSDFYVIDDVSVQIDISHARPNDLRVTLTSPAGTTISLPVSGGSGTAFVGENVDGDWTLKVTDVKKKKTGTLNGWSLTMEHSSAAATSPISPLVMIPTARDINGGGTSSLFEQILPDAEFDSANEPYSSLPIATDVRRLPSYAETIYAGWSTRRNTDSIREIAIDDFFSSIEPDGDPLHRAQLGSAQ